MKYTLSISFDDFVFDMHANLTQNSASSSFFVQSGQRVARGGTAGSLMERGLKIRSLWARTEE